MLPLSLVLATLTSENVFTSLRAAPARRGRHTVRCAVAHPRGNQRTRTSALIQECTSDRRLHRAVVWQRLLTEPRPLAHPQRQLHRLSTFEVLDLPALSGGLQDSFEGSQHSLRQQPLPTSIASLSALTTSSPRVFPRKFSISFNDRKTSASPPIIVLPARLQSPLAVLFQTIDFDKLHCNSRVIFANALS